MNQLTSKYRIGTNNCTIVISYFVEQLRLIEVERNDNFMEFWGLLDALSDDRSKSIENLKRIAKVRELKVNTTNQKIALWCELYKRQYGYNYKVSTAEASAIKNADVTVELINLFFDLNEWWSKEKTISRYTKNINEIKRIYTGKAKQTSGRNTKTSQGNRTDLAREFQRRYGDNKQSSDN